MLGLTKNLIVLERGTDEVLLANSFHLRPLYVQRGKERVKYLLAAAAHGLSEEERTATFAKDTALIELLRDYHILVDGSEIDAEAEAAPPHPKNRVTLYLLLCESCNLDCVYCLNGAATYEKHHHARMSPNTAFRGIEMCLDEAVPGGTVEVAFFGGEPLLQWPLVKEIIRHCEDELKPTHLDKRINYHLTSNLTLAPPDLVEWVIRHDIKIVCGIDGPPEIQDRCRPYRGGGPSHARSAKTIRKLVKAGAHVTLRATITAANHDRLADVAAHHGELGAASSLFVPVRPINSDRELFPEELLPDPDTIIAAALDLGRDDRPGKANLFPFNDFSPEIRPGVRNVVACGAPYGTTYVVRVNGDVYPCIYLVGQDRYRLGTVDAPLDTRPLENMLKAFHVDNRKDCRACVWRYACGGGCPVMTMARVDGATNSPAVDAYCQKITCGLSRAVLADNLWRLVDQVNMGPAAA